MAQMKTTMIRVTSRASVKIRDNFYTVEYAEERVVPEGIEVNLEEERQELWDTCNIECDRQIQDIQEIFNDVDKKVKK